MRTPLPSGEGLEERLLPPYSGRAGWVSSPGWGGSTTPLLHPLHPQKQGADPLFIGYLAPLHPIIAFFL